MAEDFDAIFVKGPVVIFKWRNQPGWPVEYASANAVEVFGYAADEFLRGEVAYGALIVEADRERVTREVAAAASSGAAAFSHQPYRITHRDGGVHWLSDFTHVVRDADGAATHYLGYVIDITARIHAEDEARALERRLLHAQKLESLGLLAGGVAHDFNNLLTGILGQAGLARRRLDRVAGDFADALDQIERLTRRAAELTRQLLAYSGQGSFVVEPVDVGQLVRDLAGMIEIVVPKTAELELALVAGLPAVVADRAQLQQIVINLLSNAAEALGERPGHITVRTGVEYCAGDAPGELERLGALGPGYHVTLEVIDTGCGMNAEVQRRLFDPFFTTKLAGRGLGMSAVLGIVRAHHGGIRVASAPGTGSSFKLWLPASERSVAAGDDRARPDPAPRRGHILIVDDDLAIRTTLQQILEGLGHTVVTAGNGVEALARFDQPGPAISVVLLDMTMPVMAGPETLRHLRERAPRLPVVMTSGYSERAATRGVDDGGLTRFLQKPYGLEDIERMLDTVLAAAPEPVPAPDAVPEPGSSSSS